MNLGNLSLISNAETRSKTPEAFTGEKGKGDMAVERTGASCLVDLGQGWRSNRRYLPLQDDIASVAYWYQTLPTVPFPEHPDIDCLEII